MGLGVAKLYSCIYILNILIYLYTYILNVLIYSCTKLYYGKSCVFKELSFYL